MSNALPAQEFSVKSLSIEDILSKSDGIYAIPAYQRAYSWEETQISTLMRDLIDYYHNQTIQREPYSLGTIVCDRYSEDGSIFLILDGQQRLTTIDLILSEIEQRLAGDSKQKINNEQRKGELITAYCYLNGAEPDQGTPLPPHARQSEIIRGMFEGDKGIAVKDLPKFKECILKNVVVNRIVIPLCGELKNEAATMFEIINMRGQRLSNLDIVKSRLISLIPEDRPGDRKAFNQLWSSYENLLNRRRREGLNFKAAEKFLGQEKGVAESGMTFDDILLSEKLLSVDDNNSKEKSEEENQQSNLLPPIDMTNLLVMALVLLRVVEAGWDTENIKVDALGEKGLLASIDSFMKESREQPENDPQINSDSRLWSLMCVMNLLLQTVTNWTPYRIRGNSGADVDDGEEKTPFSQLQRSFMAANSYQYSSQYWLLVLAITVMRNYSKDSKKLPEDVRGLLNMHRLDFNGAEVKEEAFLNLVAWGYKRCLDGMKDGTKGIFEINSNAPRDCIDALKKKVPSACLGWTYDGQLTMWHLYFIDYLIWLDRYSKKSSLMYEVMDRCVAKCNVFSEAFESMKGDGDFGAKVDSARIVARGAIEHWLPQAWAIDERGEFDNSSLQKRHGLGNLALIDASLNSTIRDNSVELKQQTIMKAKNPSMKLMWLAFLSKYYPKLKDDDIEPLSEMWGDYMRSFQFDNIH